MHWTAHAGLALQSEGPKMGSLLYVDDEETIGRAVSRWFERRGHEVHLARSVDDAKRILIEHEPAAIFLDVWLGKESGFELMGWIEDMRPELADRVTFVTGELADSHGAGHRVWKTLGRPVLQKPFEFAQLETYAFGAVDAPRRSGR
jgi:DNA-binding NtrC family response regulator